MKLSGISGTETGTVITIIHIALGTWIYAQINLKMLTNLEVTWEKGEKDYEWRILNDSELVKKNAS